MLPRGYIAEESSDAGAGMAAARSPDAFHDWPHTGEDFLRVNRVRARETGTAFLIRGPAYLFFTTS
jgi:hypothetical protein